MAATIEKSRVYPRPWVAVALSIIPGAGQCYNRHWRKGIAFLVATVVSLVPAIALLMTGEGFGQQLLHGGHALIFLLVSLLALAAFFLFFLMAMYFWASAASDASHSAREIHQGVDCSDSWWFFHFA